MEPIDWELEIELLQRMVMIATSGCIMSGGLGNYQYTQEGVDTAIDALRTIAANSLEEDKRPFNNFPDIWDGEN